MNDPAAGDTGHLTTNPRAEPVLPDYAGACLTNLVPALLAGPDHSPEWLPESARGANQVVLLVIDGLGWEQLQDRASIAPTLAGAALTGIAITSVAPTTTATALTSIVTGRTPSDHGVLGYRLAVAGDEVLNVLRWQVGSNAPGRSTEHPRGPVPALPAISRCVGARAGRVPRRVRRHRVHRRPSGRLAPVWVSGPLHHGGRYAPAPG